MEQDVLDKLSICLKEDEGLSLELCKAESISEFSEVLHSKGINISNDDMNVLFKQIKSVLGENSELNEDSLDNVSGGLIINPALRLILKKSSKAFGAGKGGGGFR